METLWHDLRFTLRSLSKQPGFTAVAVITLALGIGAGSAIFSVVDAVLLSPLPYEDPEELVMLREATPFSPPIPMSAQEFLRLRETSRALAGVAALDLVDFNVIDATGVERRSGAMVSTDFFEIFGVHPALGRGFAAEEGEPGRNNVALVSHSLWQSRFGGREDAIGDELRMNWNASFGPRRELGQSFTIIGVLPPEFISPMGPRDVWIPLALSAEDIEGGVHYLFPFARLAPRADLETARSELSEILRAIPRPDAQASGHQGEIGVTVVSLPQRAVGRVRPALLLVSGAVVFVLLIACANVANLLLARASAREREIAVRMSLGASRGRLLRQLLVESLVLASLGCTLGLAVARGGVAALHALQPAALPRLAEIAINADVLLFTAGMALVTTLVFGLVPALRASTPRRATALRDGEGGTFGTGSRLRRSLVIAEITLAVVLLVGAGLLLRSFGRLLDVDLGFQGERVLTFAVALPQKYRDREQRHAFYREALERLAAVPEIESAAAINTLPRSFRNTVGRFIIEGRPAEDAGYFETLGIPLLLGELPRLEDVSVQPKVAVVNRAMARRFWGEENPIGWSVKVTGLGPNAFRVIGIVGDVRQRGAAQVPPPAVYIAGLVPRAMSFAVRGAGEPEALSEAVRRTIRSIDPEQPIHDVQPMDRLGTARLSRPRFNAFLLALFAALALVLSAVGIYGVLNFSVSRRTREMGVRMALGARRGDVLRLVVGQGLRLVLLGLGIGIVASFGLTRFLGSLLFGVTATDPATFAAISGVLVAVALAAVYLPARRATRVEVVTALRHE